MGGVFGVTARRPCKLDLFYGTDYHSHLGTCRGGLATLNGGGFVRHIHDITNAQFRSKFEHDIDDMHGNMGIGVISDDESQPLIIGSHLGTYAIVTVGKVNNTEVIVEQAFHNRVTHFSEMSGGGINQTELIATLINQGETFLDGLRTVQRLVDGSCSLLLLTKDGIYAMRDRLGRTPLVVGRREDAYAVSLETTAFANLNYEVERFLGPGEIVFLSADGVESIQPPGDQMQVCAFLWVYYGFPASSYEGINTEAVRYACGAALARNDDVEVDLVAGVPDSGTGHAIGYANESGVAYGRPFAKYTPTWPRSFMPQSQEQRDLVARMKLIPIRELIRGKRLLFCEDSIVRGTQLKDTVHRLYDFGAREVHMRPACPPLTYGCKFLNFSRSRSEMDLASRQAIQAIDGDGRDGLQAYANPDTEQYAAMVEWVRQRLALTTLRFQRLDDLIGAIGLPREKLCTYCWDGCEGCGAKANASENQQEIG